MRHESLLLSIEASRDLIAKVDGWCRRTGCNYNKLVTAARVNPSTRHYVKLRDRRLTVEVADRLKDTMARYPHGIDKAEHRQRVRRIERERLSIIKTVLETIPQPVDRTPCPRCGVRRDIGCEHWRK